MPIDGEKYTIEGCIPACFYQVFMSYDDRI
jgi:hypothetical protein